MRQQKTATDSTILIQPDSPKHCLNPGSLPIIAPFLKQVLDVLSVY